MNDTEVAISIPSAVAEFLDGSDSNAVKAVMGRAKIQKKGRGWQTIATETLETHWALLDFCWPLFGAGSESETRERRGYRAYMKRILEAQERLKLKGDKANG